MRSKARPSPASPAGPPPPASPAHTLGKFFLTGSAPDTAEAHLGSHGPAGGSPRRHVFCFRLPHADASWLAANVEAHNYTTQGVLLSAIDGVRRRSPFLASLLGSPPVTPATVTSRQAAKSTLVALEDDDARWVFVEAALRATTAPRFLASLVRDIRLGGSVLLDELRSPVPIRSPTPLEHPARAPRTEVRLLLWDATWFSACAAQRRTSASLLLARLLEDIRAGRYELLLELSRVGDNTPIVRSLNVPDPTRRLSTALSLDTTRWLNVFAAHHLMTTQALLDLLISHPRTGRTSELLALFRDVPPQLSSAPATPTTSTR